METILSKLEEAVITKDVENNISFTNEKGQKNCKNDNQVYAKQAQWNKN